jgi:hypothetical protein
MRRCIGAGAGRLQSFNFISGAASLTLDDGASAGGRGGQPDKESRMNFPQINLDQIPGLEGAAALFGSVLQAGDGPIDDRIVDIMVFLYEAMPPEALL